MYFVSDSNSHNENKNVDIKPITSSDLAVNTESTQAVRPATEKPVSESVTLQKPSNWENNEEIKIFRDYLRIPSVHPDVDYGNNIDKISKAIENVLKLSIFTEPCVEFLKKQAISLNLSMVVYHPANDKYPVVVMTWIGSRPMLSSIMLNSHMDVVPVYEEFWTHPPFAAEMDENGDIFARGAQDMKSVGMQYLAAIRALKRNGIERLTRTVYVVYVAEEEAGGIGGMEDFVSSDPFKLMNVTFVLDEGAVAIDKEGTMPVFFAERTIWQIEFIFHGHSGHGSILFENTPGEKLNYVIGKLSEYRKNEARKLHELNYPEGNVTSINLTILKGGIENNVIPAEMSATYDIRISIDTDLNEFEQMVENEFILLSKLSIFINFFQYSVHRLSDGAMKPEVISQSIHWLKEKRNKQQL